MLRNHSTASMVQAKAAFEARFFSQLSIAHKLRLLNESQRASSGSSCAWGTGWSRRRVRLGAQARSAPSTDHSARLAFGPKHVGTVA